MRVRLIRDDEGEIKLLCSDGTICIPDESILYSLLFNFKDTIFSCTECGKWSPLALDMALVPGETLAYVTDDYSLVIIDPSGFELINDNSQRLGPYISLQEYAKKVNRSQELIKVFCRRGRILGAKKLNGQYGRWIIPENAPYPVPLSRRHKD